MRRSAKLVVAWSMLWLLAACTNSGAADQVQVLESPTGAPMSSTIRDIDWVRAERDGADVPGRVLRQAGRTLANVDAAGPVDSKEVRDSNRSLDDDASQRLLDVPLLLLPSTLQLNAPEPVRLTFDEPKLLKVRHGYRAVQQGERFDIVIDGSSQTLGRDAAELERDLPADFDASFQAIEGGGGEQSIGRYGALYSVQVICRTPAATPCATEALLGELIQYLQVRAVGELLIR